MRNLRLLGAVGLLLCFAACQPVPVPPTPSPTEAATTAPSETSRFPTYTGPLVRATLPPTWTPTFTPSPAPPEPTRTPTSTPTTAPTLTAAEVCAGFTVTDNLKDGQHFTTNDNIALIFGTSTTDSVVRFLARLRGSDKNLGVQAPGGQLYEMQFALAKLPGPGTYDWTLSAHVDAYGDLCTRRGWFTLTVAPTPEATAALAATETVTAEATAAATPDATAEATIPIIYSSDLPLPMR